MKFPFSARKVDRLAKTPLALRAAPHFTEEPGRVVTAAYYVIYGLLLLGSVAFTWLRPPHLDWDALPYMDLALISEGQTAQGAHAAVYREIQGTRDSGLASSGAWARGLAASSFLFDEQLPFFSFRPGYILMIRLGHQSGLGLLKAARLVSAAGYIGMGIVLFLWLLRHASAPLALFGGAAIMLSGGGWGGGALALAQLVTPDAISTFILLLGLYCVLEVELLAPGFVLLLGSLFFRSDNVLYVLAVVAWATFTHRLKPYQGVVLGLTGCGVVWLLDKYSGNYGWTVLFNNSFMPLKLHASEELAAVSFREYSDIVLRNFRNLLETYAPFLFALGLASYLARPRNRACLAAALAVVVTSARFLLYPTAALRQYAPAVLICGLATFVVLSERREAVPSASASLTSPNPTE